MWFLLSWLISIEIMQILLVPSLPISSSFALDACVCVSVCLCVCVCVSVCSIAIKTDTWPVVFLFFVAFLRPPLLLLRCLLLVCAFSGSESVARRTSCSTGSCCCCSSSSCCCCWPPLLSRLGCSAYLPQAFVVPVLPPSLLALLHFSPLSRFSFLI